MYSDNNYQHYEEHKEFHKSPTSQDSTSPQQTVIFHSNHDKWPFHLFSLTTSLIECAWHD